MSPKGKSAAKPAPDQDAPRGKGQRRNAPDVAMKCGVCDVLLNPNGSNCSQTTTDDRGRTICDSEFCDNCDDYAIALDTTCAALKEEKAPLCIPLGLLGKYLQWV